jgi:hypothetical protein
VWRLTPILPCNKGAISKQVTICLRDVKANPMDSQAREIEAHAHLGPLSSYCSHGSIFKISLVMQSGARKLILDPWWPIPGTMEAHPGSFRIYGGSFRAAESQSAPWRFAPLSVMTQLSGLLKINKIKRSLSRDLYNKKLSGYLIIRPFS